MNETLSQARGRIRMQIAMKAKEQILALRTFATARNKYIKAMIENLKNA